jgi:hypothetical protein
MGRTGLLDIVELNIAKRPVEQSKMNGLVFKPISFYPESS